MDRDTISRLLDEARQAHLRGDDAHIAETTFADGRWVQVVPFSINLDYPLKRSPKKLLKQLSPPDSVRLDSWRRKEFVTISYDDDHTDGLTDFVLRYIDATSR